VIKNYKKNDKGLLLVGYGSTHLQPGSNPFNLQTK